MTISADILNSYEYPEINIDDLLAQEIEKDDLNEIHNKEYFKN